MKVLAKFVAIFTIFISTIHAGAGFESESYLIWIRSFCPMASTTCTDVEYNQTDKSDGKTIVVKGGEPIVGNLSGNLIGYKFYDKKNNFVYELSMDLNGAYTLYIRAFDGKAIGRSFKQEKINPLKEESFNKKIAKVKK